ncbi:Transcriptional regulator, ArsR family [Cupriavidus basilensis]|uniref:Transcriptional regulator, ArsR family n=2 Tax=Cupriavidus basilensis TaxID=68895 RepID=A0A0C4YLD2_9BURK|nr:Transcriptional regulator, ArsR family [Cupriavidus basilensis]
MTGVKPPRRRAQNPHTVGLPASPVVGLARASPAFVALVFGQYFQYYGNMEENEAIRSLAALAHGLRLQVFRLLVVAGPSGLTPGAMTEQIGVPGATLSFHLKELMNASLITQEREGRHLIYRAAFEHMNDLLGFLTANCCQGEACFDNTAATVCAC